jgi:hypothetical protein
MGQIQLIPLIIICAVCFIIGIILDNLVHLLFGKKEPSNEPLPAPGPSDEVLPDSSLPAGPELEDIVHVQRDSQDGQLVVGVRGINFRSVHDMSEEQNKQVSQSVSDLSEWLKRPAPVVVAQPTPPPPVPSPVTKPDKAKTPAPYGAGKSIAVQVDEILQEMLVNSPQAKRGIRITESPDAGLAVYVGLEKFDGVDAIPYNDVKEIIRTAVAEWRNRTSVR